MTHDTISHYRVLDKLGEGGMGSVYRAVDTRLGRTVPCLQYETTFDEAMLRSYRELPARARQQITLTPDKLLRSPAWSPDGRTIAYGVLSRTAGLQSFLAATPAEGGSETRIGSRAWYTIHALDWLPDGNGIIAIANAQWPLSQLWYVTYPGGETRGITNDLNSYNGLSLTTDAGALVTVQNETISHIWLVAPNDPGSAREISTGRLDALNGIAWAGNGNIYFEAPESGGDTQIWITAPDGEGRRQIRSEGLTGKPQPCGDGRQLVFLSYRTGTPHIWRSDLDGGNLRQVTSGGGEWGPSCSPDGTWITYDSSSPSDPKSSGIWRVPTTGGTAIRIWDRGGAARISPDGKSVLLRDAEGVRIIPANGGRPIKRFDPAPELGSGVIEWSADGTALLCVKTVGGVSNIWRHPLDGSQPKQVTSFTSQRITSFAVSRDSKRLALARGTTSSDVVLIKDLNQK